MKKINVMWGCFCLLCFFLGAGITRLFFIRTITISPSANKEQSVLQLRVPQIPLPPNWSAKTNLPGNSFGTAFVLNPGIKIQGTLNTNNVIDYYVFDLKDPSQIQINLTDVPKALFWVLYDSQQNEVASTYRTGSVDGSTQVSLNNPGKYYIKVWADYHELVNYPYTIRLTILPYFE